MSVYVDPLMNHGWKLQGRMQLSCHMFADTEGELHELAESIGLARAWFQAGIKGKIRPPHYDLTMGKRRDAIRAGVVQVSKREAVNIWRKLKESNED